MDDDLVINQNIDAEMHKFDDFRNKYWERKPDGMEGSETEIAYIISSHLYMEQIMNSIISLVFPYSDKLLGFTFSNKVKIIEALDISSSEAIGYILALNSIRNKFAHNLDYKTSFEDLKKLAPSLKRSQWNEHNRLRLLYWCITDAISHVSIYEVFIRRAKEKGELQTYSDLLK